MSAQIIELSANPARATPQEVMQMDSFKDFTEEQAVELLRIVETFCGIAYGIWKREEVKQAGNIKVLPLQTKLKRAA